jgi:hypothetical protein
VRGLSGRKEPIGSQFGSDNSYENPTLCNERYNMEYQRPKVLNLNLYEEMFSLIVD